MTLFDTIMSGDLQKMQDILAHTVVLPDDMSHGTKSRSLLHFAVDYNRREMVRLLLQRGANANASDRFGWTPLHVAIFQRNVDIVDILISHGADVNRKDDDLWTPLHFVTAQIQTSAKDVDAILSIIAVLMANGANPFCVNMCRKSAIDMALENHNNVHVMARGLLDGLHRQTLRAQAIGMIRMQSVPVDVSGLPPHVQAEIQPRTESRLGLLP